MTVTLTYSAWIYYCWLAACKGSPHNVLHVHSSSYSLHVVWPCKWCGTQISALTQRIWWQCILMGALLCTKMTLLSVVLVCVGALPVALVCACCCTDTQWPLHQGTITSIKVPSCDIILVGMWYNLYHGNWPLWYNHATGYTCKYIVYCLYAHISYMYRQRTGVCIFC